MNQSIDGELDPDTLPTWWLPYATSLPVHPGQSKVRRYTRRQRKRRHVGEFAQTGVDLRVRFAHAVDWDEVIDELFAVFDDLGLEAGGFGGGHRCTEVTGGVCFTGNPAQAVVAFEALVERLRRWPLVEVVQRSRDWDGWWSEPP